MPVNRAGRLLGRRVLAVVGVVLAGALAAPGFASAETFAVNSTADEVDATVGDEFCVTAAGKCTLRAAIEEANFADGEDAINFEDEEGVFEGDSDSVIQPASPLPAITAPLTLRGGRCETEAGVSGPCIEIEAGSGETALSVDGAERVNVESLAFTGGAIGLEAKESKELWVNESWFGVKLDGSADGHGTGIRLGAGSDKSRIGGEGSEAGNLFVDSTIGLDLLGASKVRVLGNDFGVGPTGIAAANGTNIAVASTNTSAAINNAVGTRVAPDKAATAACDGGCNLLYPALSTGIEAAGNGGGRLPPVGTTIAGNMIGFDATGVGVPPNAGIGIYVDAPNTTIGGTREGDVNRIAGGTVAIEGGPAAPFLVVRGNLIGSAAGDGAQAPTQSGISINSTFSPLPAEEAVVLDNQIGLSGGGTGISQGGFAATIAGNLLEGGETGIRVHSEAIGSRVSSNVIEGTSGAGVLIETSGNQIFANRIAEAGTVGIRVQGPPPFGVGENVIGGDAATEENLIDNSAGAAVELQSLEGTRNEVARNRGAGNDGLFVDLVPVDANTELEGPNGGILPPAIAAISEAGVAGFAEPGALVRVFRKATPDPGEIASFLGQATADEDGNWSLAFPAPLPVGAAIAATQTLGGGTSELEIAAVPPPTEGPPPPVGDAALDRKPPRTRVLRQPRRVLEGGVARFAFTSNEAGSRFQCSLDGGKYRACKSPKRYRGLRPGKHVFRVRAIDAAGNVDRTPVRRRFEVLG